MIKLTGIPTINSTHRLLCAHIKTVRYIDIISDQIRRLIIKKLTLRIPHIELNTNHTILLAGTANTYASQAGLSGDIDTIMAKIIVATSQTQAIEVIVIITLFRRFRLTRSRVG